MTERLCAPGVAAVADCGVRSATGARRSCNRRSLQFSGIAQASTHSHHAPSSARLAAYLQAASCQACQGACRRVRQGRACRAFQACQGPCRHHARALRHVGARRRHCQHLLTHRTTNTHTDKAQISPCTAAVLCHSRLLCLALHML